ncbi:MAG: hypothetical protein ACI94Y_002662 [Maribacter sp.]|jgi:hypothetical protein
MMTEKSAKTLGNQPNKNEALELSLLRDLLLKEDREGIADIWEHLDNSEKLAEKINPIVEIHLESLKRKFPKEYKKQVETIIERKLKSSQDELLNLIYPVMGKMIKKFIVYQFDLLKEQVDQKVEQTFSMKNWRNRFKATISGVKKGDIVLRELDRLSIEEVYVIERDSGILMGHFSKNKTIDMDLVAGMLTAIKSFVENAFSKKRQDLEMIESGTYKIFIQSFHLYYIPIILDGSVSTSEKQALSAKVLDFAEEEMSSVTPSNHTEADFKQLSSKLATYFN